MKTTKHYFLFAIRGIKIHDFGFQLVITISKIEVNIWTNTNLGSSI